MIALILSLSLAHAQAPLGWEVLDEAVLAAPAAEANISQLPLDLLVEEGSLWSLSALRLQLSKSSTILRQCGVVIGEVSVQTVRYAPETLRALNVEDPYKGPAELYLMRGIPTPVARPMGFLFAKSIPSTASAYNAESVRRLTFGTIDASPLLNTFHITEQSISNRVVPGAAASYNTFAHELVHLAGNLGHIDLYGNLMSSRDGRNSKTGQLTVEQCNAIKRFPLLVNPE